MRLLFSSGPAAAHRHRGPVRRSLRCPPHRWRMVADWWLGASTRCPARPCRRPRAPQPGPPVPPAPSTPVGLVSLIGASPRSPARPRRPRTPSDRAVSPDERDKTPPAPHVKCTTGTKLSPHTTKRRYQAISRLQGELCTAQSTNKPSRENFVPHTGPPPGRNSPRTKPGGPNRYKTLPAGSPNGPPGTKLSQHTTKRRYQAISRLQGELFHAYGRGTPSRENFVPHTGPLAGQNSPRSTHQPKQRDKILPARHKTLILACFTHAGRVLSRI